MARVKRPFGNSFVSALAIDREIDGGGYNRVFGPDFQWRHGEHDTVTGQLIFSQSHTPDRPDLADEWDGRHLAGHAGLAWWQHSTKHVDWFTQVADIGDEFRADSGFVPQVGYRQLYGEAGYTIRPEGGPVRRQRLFSYIDHQDDQDGSLLQQFFALGTGLDAKWNSFLQFRYQYDKIRAGETVFPRHSGNAIVQFSPSRVFNQINVEAHFGQEIDFDNERLGHGASVLFSANVRPTDHLSLSFNNSRRFLDVDDPARGNSRLFTARVDRLRVTYTFNARSFVRLIGQWVETTRDPSLYVDEVSARDKDFGGSALIAYKLNWQTVLFLGYGDNRALSEDSGDVQPDTLQPTDRSLFIKLSYAFQR
jgi:hypothetical protein